MSQSLKLLAALAIIALSGCTIITHEGAGTKTTIVMPAIGNRSITSADLQKGTVNGVTSEQTKLREAIEVGVAAGVKSLKP
jgi:hypothetical protein